MPVVPVAPTSPPQTATDAPAAPAGGFDELLSAQLPEPSSLPSVPLGAMVSAFVEGPTMPSLPDEAAATAVARTGEDPWGVAATRARPADRTSAAPTAGGPGAAVIEAGERYLGVPYKWGGTSASTGFDCSGFVQQVYADLGVRLPRVSVDQSKAGRPVASLADAQPGDLVFWRASGGRPNHIGIYAGDGQMLVAPRTGDVVRYQDISRTPDAIRRVLT